MTPGSGTLRLPRRQFLADSACAAGALPLLLAGAQAQAEPTGRPNIVVILSDQQHGGACGFNDTFFHTPNLDQLASDSVVFDRFFCTTPQCSPSRSSILTGLYPHQTRVLANMGAGKPGEIPQLSRETIGLALQRAGYHTAYFGKWHLGEDSVGTSGWDESELDLSHNGNEDSRTTQSAVQFLERSATVDKPFALFVSYINPHDIYHYRPGEGEPPKEETPLPPSWNQEDASTKPPCQETFMRDDQGKLLYGRLQKDWEGYRSFYRDRLKDYDAELGKVLAALEKTPGASNTLTVVSSDHGDMDAAHRLIFKGPFMYEEMVRVPLVIRLPTPKSRGPRRVDSLTSNVDLFPTLLDFAGVAIPDCQGLSLKQGLLGEAGFPEREYVVGQYYGKQKWINPIRMIRTRRWKYNLYLHEGEELYDLANDPHEVHNLADDPSRRGLKRDLRAELDRWMVGHDDPFYTYTLTDRDGNSREFKSYREDS